MRPVVVPFFISHLGCPHRCVFCDQEKISGSRAALPDTQAIQEKIEAFRASAPGRQLEVAFYGGSFTALAQEQQVQLLGTLQPYLAAGTVSSLRISTRPDAVDHAAVSLLERMGVGTVELGVQSMNDEVLQLSGRGHASQDSEQALATLKGRGFRVGVQLMPGLPGDTLENSLTSLKRVLQFAPSFLRIYPTLVVEGTELAELYRRGSYRPLPLDEAVAWCKELLKLARRAGVPVVRLGLQPTEELETPGTILAGPFHPAFGQLVESELCCDLMASLLEETAPGSEVSFRCTPGRISDLVGQRRRNLERLTELFAVRILKVTEDAALDREVIALDGPKGVRLGSLADWEPGGETPAAPAFVNVGHCHVGRGV
ncbi:radical SAM protein [Geomonas limicola]|uniref:Radical SAM protein n=1 Tax=Geomonas limicola TaxID=2740186 RepID=A0A6V8N6E5_9BACT|nr:radical SAM protein [Geomonas limicola]GFO68155.1 radical SAM protein [Geomonas limicola]